jgi:hypothetical protein
MRTRGLWTIGLLLAGPACAFDTIWRDGFDTPDNFASPLGTNLEAVLDFSSAYSFVDAFKQSRFWITADRSNFVFDTQDAACLDLDADGWVRSLTPQTAQRGCDTPAYDSASTLFFFNDDLAGHYPSGRYVVTYSGQGSISYHFAATKNVALSSAGRDVLDVDASQGGFMLRIDATDPGGTGDYLRDIRVFMPGFDQVSGPSQLFHPDFLRLLPHYKVLRFMDWMQTNDSQQSAFADRPRMSHARWTLTGVPLEIMVELANRTGAHPWFNMPHLATDDYITQFASRVRQLLRGDLIVYVEHSNEVWNSQFAQGNDIEARAQIAYPGGGDSGFTKRMDFHGERTAKICDLWRAAFAGATDRVVCVLGAQAANAFTQTEAADCHLSARAPCTTGIDAVAIAPYFGNYLDGPPGVTEVDAENWTLDDLFAELTVGGRLSAANGGPPGGAVAASDDEIPDHLAAANTRGLELISYEGGQHLVGILGFENNDEITTLFTTGNRDARMGPVYATYLDQWRNAGGHLFVHFSASGAYGKFGSWGAIEFLDAIGTPKRNAIEAYIAAHPCGWAGCTR